MFHGFARSSRAPRSDRRRLRVHAARVGILGTLVTAAGFVACSGPSVQGPQVDASTNPAVVTLDLRDANDNHVGSCTGTLVSSSTVVTAGHCVVASGGAYVTTADGQTAYGATYWTTWQNFQSPYSHPQHSDIAVILLDRQLFAPAYPTLSASIAEDGVPLSRVRRVDSTSVAAGGYEQIVAPVHLGTAMGFPLAYTMNAADFEGDTDTGGPLIDPSTNTLYGVVSGRGTSTGTIYVSRVEYLGEWIQAAASCSPPPLQAQCHPKPPTCDGGGSSSSSGGSSSSSGGAGSSGSGGSSGGAGSSGSSSGGWGGSNGGSSGGSSGGGGSSSGASSGGSSGGSSGSSSGGWSSSGSSSGAGSGSGGSSGGSGSGGSSGGGGDDGGTCAPPPPPPPPPPPNNPDGGCSSGGSSGGSTSSSSGATPGGSSGSGGSGGNSSGGSSGGSSSGGSSGSSSGSTPVILPPDGPGCFDASCGGCGDDPSCDDGQTDYGNCGCQPSGPSSGGQTQ